MKSQARPKHKASSRAPKPIETQAAESAVKQRFTIDFDEIDSRRLLRMKTMSGQTKAGVFRDALKLYEYVIERTAEGYKFKLESPDGSSVPLPLIG